MRTFQLIYESMQKNAKSIITSHIKAINLYGAIYKAGNYRYVNGVRYELVEVKLDD